MNELSQKLEELEERIAKLEELMRLIHGQLFGVSLIAKIDLVFTIHHKDEKEEFAALVLNRVTEVALSLREEFDQDPTLIKGFLLGVGPVLPTLKAMVGQGHPSVKELENALAYLSERTGAEDWAEGLDGEHPMDPNGRF